MTAPNAPIKLLMIEDNPLDVRLIREMLAETRVGFELAAAERLADGLRLLSEGTFDVLLLDLNLPDSRGVDTLNSVYSRAPSVPIIVLTGLQDETMGTRAISEGAQDYLVKGQVDPPLLVRSIQYATERKKFEKELQESEARYKKLFDSTLDGIYQADADGAFVMINRAGAEMLGHQSPGDLIGKPVLAYWAAPGDRDAFVAELRRNKSVRAYPMRAKSIKGEVVHLEATSRVLEDERGVFLGIEGILRNVTEKRRLEEQFRQAQKMEAVGQLAGGVAHDFNNILSAIMGYAHLVLMKMQPDDPLRHDVGQVIESAQRAASLTQGLLAFSRKQTIQLKALDLGDVVCNFEKFLRRLIREDIELRMSCGERGLTVLADAGQLEQVLLNLVTNSRDAMPDGGRLIVTAEPVRIDDEYVRLHGYGDPGDYAQVTISDTGTGMDEKTRAKIFEPFFTTKEPGKGTGLGLAVVYGIIKQHGGFINVYSEAGKGSTFKIYLPVVKMAAAPGERKAAEPAVTGGTETVLVAEDDEASRRLEATVLKHFGYTVIEAVDGEDAVRKFVEHKDVLAAVVLDVIMPKKNGAEVYREIKAIRPDVKVLFSSGYTEDILEREGILAEGAVLLLKPVMPKELVRKVREALDKK